MRLLRPFLIITALVTRFAAPAASTDYFEINIVDERSGRGVPLVELETVNHLLFVTDSAGRVAFNEPGLMNTKVFFFVRSHGYEFPKDGFGYAGKAVEVRPGGRATLKLTRRNSAERLYRITGQGIYRDSELLGKPAPAASLNAQVLGQDSVQAAVYRGKIYWFWGDTLRARHPLGNYQTTGATSELPSHGGLDPAAGVALRYFTDSDGFTKRMIPFPESGPIWIDGLLTVKDEAGRDRLVAHYSRMENVAKRVEHGLLIFNDELERFDKLTQLDLSEEWRFPAGHPIRVTDKGEDFFYFPHPFCATRVKATLASIKSPASYEAFTCLANSDPGNSASVDHDADGRARFAWRANAKPLTQKEERALVASGKLKAADARYAVTNGENGKPVLIHDGSIQWNAYRKKWLLIAVEQYGSSFLGEVWFAEADEPTGPWRSARKVVTHNHYSFYNPAQHPFFDQQDGRLIYFEGTYTKEFSGNPAATPRYDYNQVMYRLDLNELNHPEGSSKIR